MTIEPRFVYYTAKSQNEAARIVQELIERSLYFSVQPFPDDEWSIQTRDEAGIPPEFKVKVNEEDQT